MAAQKKAPAKKAAAKAPVEKAAAKAPAKATTVVFMLHQITGTRDNEPWPGRGEKATLPAAEAAQLIAQSMASLEAPESR